MKNTYSAIAERINERAQFPGSENNRLRNPLPATLTTTGGGKSRHLDEVGALLPGDLHDLCKDSKLREILCNSVSVSVTFNGATPLCDGVDDKVQPGVSVALRLLHRY